MTDIVPAPDGEPAPQEEPATGSSEAETLKDLIEEQDAEAEKYAIEFLKKVLRIRGVKIEREVFLRQELRKLGLSDALITEAVEATPIQAGVALQQLDGLAAASIDFETRKSAAMSFTAGLPGGLAMLATVPADITQYYVHTFRVMQKLSYVYGWRDFLGDLDEADDETIGKVAVFLGVMMGVGGASASFGNFAKAVARPALQKQIANKALMKSTWYPAMKQTLRLVGVKVTRDSFARTVTKAVPVAGGVISGGMTLVALSSQSKRLQQHLRELPPPGVDAAEYLAALHELDAEHDDVGVLSGAKESLGRVTEGAGAAVKDVAGDASSSAREAAGRARASAGALLKRGTGRLSRRRPADDEPSTDE